MLKAAATHHSSTVVNSSTSTNTGSVSNSSLPQLEIPNDKPVDASQSVPLSISLPSYVAITSKSSPSSPSVVSSPTIDGSFSFRSTTKLSQSESLKSLKDKVSLRLRSKSNDIHDRKLVDQLASQHNKILSGDSSSANVNSNNTTPINTTITGSKKGNRLMPSTDTQVTTSSTVPRDSSIKVTSTHAKTAPAQISNIIVKSDNSPSLRCNASVTGFPIHINASSTAAVNTPNSSISSSSNNVVVDRSSSLLDDLHATPTTKSRSGTKAMPAIAVKEGIDGSNGIILVDNEALAHKNDMVLHDRLQEAKAMNRKKEPGAIMHQFSLWSNIKSSTAAPITSSVTTPTHSLTTSSSIVVGHSSEVEKKLSRIRGPKAAIRVLNEDTTVNTKSAIDEDASSSSNSSHNIAGSSNSSNAASNISSSNNSNINIEAVTSAASSSLAFALRSKVGNAKNLQASSSFSTIVTDISTSDSSLGKQMDATAYTKYSSGDDHSDLDGLLGSMIIEEDDELKLMSTLKRTFVHSDSLGASAATTIPPQSHNHYSQYQQSMYNASNVDDDELAKTTGVKVGRTESQIGSLGRKDNESSTVSDTDRFETSSPLSELSQQLSDDEEGTALQGSSKDRLKIISDPNTAHDATGESASEASPVQWKKGEAIGEGTYGKVYMGLNQNSGELLAIKQLCTVGGTATDVIELRKEINIMENLAHDNIVRYLGTSQDLRYLYIILEYVSGGSIANMLTQFGAFPENLIRRFTVHILRGVDYLHNKGIIHRDIKGANILVTESGIAKLSDFGCSKQLVGTCTNSFEESMKAIRGSIPWMAPEVIKQSGYGRSSDIWSVGASMIEMSTGKPPWSDFTSNLAALFHVATSKEPPAYPTHLSCSCKAFIKQCMAIDPQDRSSSVVLMQSDFILNELQGSKVKGTKSRVKKISGDGSSRNEDSVVTDAAPAGTPDVEKSVSDDCSSIRTAYENSLADSR